MPSEVANQAHGSSVAFEAMVSHVQCFRSSLVHAMHVSLT